MLRLLYAGLRTSVKSEFLANEVLDVDCIISGRDYARPAKSVTDRARGNLGERYFAAGAARARLRVFARYGNPSSPLSLNVFRHVRANERYIAYAACRVITCANARHDEGTRDEPREIPGRVAFVSRVDLSPRYGRAKLTLSLTARAVCVHTRLH